MNPDPDEHAHPGHEDLHWGEGIKKTQRDKKPSSRYWALSEQARKMIPGESQCRMFCGGKTCKYCTSENWKPEQMVIDGLYSEWVTDNILAMARMSIQCIEKYKMIDQLIKMGVKTIINLQQPGEHAYCGNGINASGFSYDPQTFMENGFFFYNFMMGDYGVASMQKLLDIVKVTQFAVSQGKVAVHCHAGLGRTGLIIACYLIYNNRVKAGKSIQYVRSRRAGAIQTKEQVNTCHEFEQFLKLFYVIFPCRMPNMHSFSFSHFLNRQRQLLHGYEGRKLKHLPKIIYVCCERLLELCGKGQALLSLRQRQKDRLTEDIVAMDGSDSATLASESELNDEGMRNSEANISHMGKNGSIQIEENKFSRHQLPNWKTRETDRNPAMDEGTTGPRRTRNFPSNNGYNTDLHGEVNGADGDKTADDYSSDESDDRDYKLVNSHFVKPEEQTARHNQGETTVLLLDTRHVCNAILLTEYTPEEIEEIKKIEEDLNKSDETWSDLARLTQPSIVCGVMWDWLDELCEPILRAQDVYTLIENSSDLYVALSRLEKNTKYFLEYITRVLSKFEPLQPEILHFVLKRFLSHLTQKRHGNFDSSSNCSLAVMMEEKQDVAQRLFDLFMNMIAREGKRD